MGPMILPCCNQREDYGHKPECLRLRTRTKEEVYDSEIFPLMGKILEICKREKIAMVANFSTPSGDDPHLVCTSALLDNEYGPTKDQLAAFSMLRDGFIAFARTRGA